MPEERREGSHDSRNCNFIGSLCHGQALLLPGAGGNVPFPRTAGYRSLRSWKYPYRRDRPFPDGRGGSGAQSRGAAPGAGTPAQRLSAAHGRVPAGAVLLYLLRCGPGCAAGPFLVSGNRNGDPDPGPELGNGRHPEGGGRRHAPGNRSAGRQLHPIRPVPAVPR